MDLITTQDFIKQAVAAIEAKDIGALERSLENHDINEVFYCKFGDGGYNPDGGCSLLNLAIHHHFNDGVEYLINNGASVTTHRQRAKLSEGQFANLISLQNLYVAIRDNNVKAAELLIDSGAPFNLYEGRDNYGIRTAQETCVSFDNAGIAKLLVNSGAEFTIEDCSHAARNGKEEMTRFLISPESKIALKAADIRYLMQHATPTTAVILGQAFRERFASGKEGVSADTEKRQANNEETKSARQSFLERTGRAPEAPSPRIIETFSGLLKSDDSKVIRDIADEFTVDELAQLLRHARTTLTPQIADAAENETGTTSSRRM
jgi:hypothetical protein